MTQEDKNNRQITVISTGGEQINKPMFSFDREEDKEIKKMFVSCDTATNSSFISIFGITSKELKTKEDNSESSNFKDLLDTVREFYKTDDSNSTIYTVEANEKTLELIDKLKNK